MLHWKIIIVLVFLFPCFAFTASVQANGNVPAPLINPSAGKIKIGESITLTSSVLGGYPPYSYQWYLNETAVPDATSDTWEFAPTASQPIGNYTVYLEVQDSYLHSAKSNSAIITVAPALKAHISPLAASIFVGEQVLFTATSLSGGYPPYTCQWYLDGKSIPGITVDNWMFIPATVGIYNVHLKVTDTTNNTALSETARIVVQSVPVGGYSVQSQRETWAPQETAYLTLTVFFGAMLSVKKRTRKSL